MLHNSNHLAARGGSTPELRWYPRVEAEGVAELGFSQAAGISRPLRRLNSDKISSIRAHGAVRGVSLTSDSKVFHHAAVSPSANRWHRVAPAALLVAAAAAALALPDAPPIRSFLPLPVFASVASLASVRSHSCADRIQVRHRCAFFLCALLGRGLVRPRVRFQIHCILVAGPRRRTLQSFGQISIPRLPRFIAVDHHQRHISFQRRAPGVLVPKRVTSIRRVILHRKRESAALQAIPRSDRSLIDPSKPEVNETARLLAVDALHNSNHLCDPLSSRVLG